jgi:hypothetical protein
MLFATCSTLTWKSMARRVYGFSVASTPAEGFTIADSCTRRTRRTRRQEHHSDAAVRRERDDEQRRTRCMYDTAMWFTRAVFSW